MTETVHFNEPTRRAHVDVTFLRMEAKPAEPPPPYPDGVFHVFVKAPQVAFYRYLQHAVGSDHLWWLRSAQSDATLRGLLDHPGIHVFVLYRNCEPAGYFELDHRHTPHINLAYFGLLPHMRGLGLKLGETFLRRVVDEAWRHDPASLMVNTNSADDPAALHLYRKVGFVPYKQVREEWNVPDRLGLVLPPQVCP